MDPITGVLVGGGIALVSNVVTQLWTSRRDAKRHDRERAERQDRELRLAYVEWLAANQRAMVLISSFDSIPKDKQDIMAFVSSINSEIALAGSKVRILETDHQARMKVAEALQIIAVFAAKVPTGDSDFMETLLEIDATARKLGELEMWVLSERFPPENGQLPAAAPESAETLPAPTAKA